MPAPTDAETRATQILDNACWLQAIVCKGCTHRFHRRADIVDGYLVFSEPECLKPECPGHNPVTGYLKAFRLLANHDVYPIDTLARYGPVQREEAADASTE